MTQTPKHLPDTLETISLVAIGQFAVDAIEPSNLYAIGSVDSRELEKCKVIFRVPEQFILNFPTLNIQAQNHQLNLTSTVEEPIFERVIDFFLSFFDASKGHSIAALGINTDFHCRVPSPERWHAIGHHLVPKEVWKGDLKLKNPGLMSVSIEAERDDGEAGVFRVRAEPSQLLSPGLYVQLNDHFNLKTEGGIDNAMRIVNTRWKDCRRRHIELIAAIRALGGAE